MKFKDHFSAHAAEYAKFRPHYPDELFEHLASISPRHELAWDCATGNGQAAVGLARHFEKVIATDASAQQIESVEPDKRISYRGGPCGSEWDRFSFSRPDFGGASAALVRSRSVFHGGKASIKRRRRARNLELQGFRDHAGNRRDHLEILSRNDRAFLATRA